MYTVDLYLRVRLACHVDGLSQREAASRFGIGRLIGRDDRQKPEAAERERPSEQSAPQETHEERQRRAQRDARKFSRLQSAAYNATGEERKAAQTEFDDYVERHSKKRETAEEEERQTHKRSRGRSKGM